jgi:hypothetical protein
MGGRGGVRGHLANFVARESRKILTIKILPAKLLILIVINNDLILKNNVCNLRKTETQKINSQKSDEIPELK